MVLRLLGCGLLGLLLAATMLLARPGRTAAQGRPPGTVTPRAMPDGGPPGEFPVTPGPAESPLLAPEGPTTVIIELDAEPVAAVIAATFGETGSIAAAAEAGRSQRTVIRQRQADLIAVLTAPPFEARLIGTTDLASVTVIVVVDASLIEPIEALPGVRRARPERTGTLDGPSVRPPGVRPGFGPTLH